MAEKPPQNENLNRKPLPVRRDPMQWIEEQIDLHTNPKEILKDLVPQLKIPDNVPYLTLWHLVFELLNEPPPRKPLPHVNSIEQVVTLVQESSNILVLTGAGVSVSCGIPDFRSRDGIYARLSKDYPDLPDPQAMFNIQYFKTNPWPFFKFAKEIFPGQFTPSLCHRFIAALDKRGKLLRNYTQNIDTLEQMAGIQNVLQCHGSFATASCMCCKTKVNTEAIKEEIFSQKIPYCKQCVDRPSNILKPDIVFFGEGLPEDFHRQIDKDKHQVDLLIVIGSSLKVRPVALIPNMLDPTVPQIFINREPLAHLHFDVELYGNCDDVIHHLCSLLGEDWRDVIGCHATQPVEASQYANTMECISHSSLDKVSDKTEKQGELCYLPYPPNRYIFHGAEIPLEQQTCSSSNGPLETSHDASNC